MKNVFLAAATALVFSACSSETDETATSAAVQESAPAPARQMNADLCLDAGPQTPRDISNKAGINPVTFPMAPPVEEMNLCNIHSHTNAEHKGPGFSVFVDSSDYGGYACNEAAELTDAELAPAPGAYGAVKPGDTIEVHWVHTSCPATPGGGTWRLCP